MLYPSSSLLNRSAKMRFRSTPLLTGLLLSAFLSWGCTRSPEATSSEVEAGDTTAAVDEASEEMQAYTVTLAGASPSGLWSLLGVGVDAALKEANSDSTATYQTSGGGFANIPLLQSGQVEMGLAHDAELLMAQAGVAPFEEPIESTRVIATLYTWAPMQVAVRRDFAEEYGIETLQDLATVEAPARIAVNKRGVVISDLSVQALEESGISEDALKSWGGDLVYAASSEQATLMQDRRIDVMTNAVFAGHSSFTQAGESLDLVMLPLEEETVEKISADTASQPFTIPAESYAWQTEEVPTFAVSASLVVDESMSEEDAYNLTKAVFENYDELTTVHDAMKELTPEIMASNTAAPYHEGAQRYLEEAGLL